MKAEHEIGGLGVLMTAAQADRWNNGCTTDRDLDVIRVAIPMPVNQARYVTLRRALNDSLEPEISRQISGYPANRVGEWQG